MGGSAGKVIKTENTKEWQAQRGLPAITGDELGWEIENGEKFRHECFIVLEALAKKYRDLAEVRPVEKRPILIRAAEAVEAYIIIVSKETRAPFWKMLVQTISNNPGAGASMLHNDLLPKDFIG